VTIREVSPKKITRTVGTNLLHGEIDKGLYVPRIPPAVINPLTGQFSVELRQAFKIEGGELKEAVRWGMISDNV